MTQDTARCPLCEAAGSVGQPCAGPLCARKGYHFIPEAYFEALRQTRRGEPDPLIGRNLDDFLLVGVLGAGAFGQVYLALRLRDGRKAALKLMSRREDDPHRAESLLRKFRTEAEALARLDHPNVVGLLGHGTWQDVPYLVMEFVEGGRTLKGLLDGYRRQGRKVEADLALHILRQILAALQTAHGQQIVHRDIKPENIMVEAVGGDPNHVKVLDFGLAKFVADGTETTQAIGTPAYMAPEQLWKTRIGPATDLYAVGVIAYELLFGRRPFSGTTEEIVKNKANPDFDVLAEVVDLDLPGPVMGFFRNALAFDPGNRIGDAATFRQALDGLPLQAERPRALETMAVGMETEQERIQRLEAEMAAERRRLDEEKRRLEAERRDLESQRLRSSGPVAAPSHPMPGAAPSEGAPVARKSSAGTFIAVAAAVLLLGLGLVIARAWMAGPKTVDDPRAAGADAGPTEAAVAAVAPPAEPDVVESQAPETTAVASQGDQVDAGAASAPAEDVAVAAEPDVATAPDLAVAAAEDLQANSGDAAAATPQPGQPVALNSEGGADAGAGDAAATDPEAAKKAAEEEKKRLARLKAAREKAAREKAAREAEERAKDEAAAREKAKQEALARQFKTLQDKKAKEAELARQFREAQAKKQQQQAKPKVTLPTIGPQKPAP